MRFLFDRLCNPGEGEPDSGFPDLKTVVLREIAQEVERICSERSSFLNGVARTEPGGVGVLGFGLNRGIGQFDDRTALRLKCAEIQLAIRSAEPRLKQVVVEPRKGQTVGKLSLVIRGVAMVDGDAFDFDRDVDLRVWR